MKRITTLISGAILATAMASPVLAGGKTVTGAPTTMPPAALAAAHAQPATTFTVKFVVDTYLFTSPQIAAFIAAFKQDIATATGVSEDRINVVVAAQ